jgi:branched-chain amino acid aminotransferase
VSQHILDPAVTAPARRPGHGDMFTGHLVTATWTPAGGWSEPELAPFADFTIHPGMIGLHYGQVIFEGLKAHRTVAGSVAVFRAADHARRFQRSARRMSMPELPEELFLRSIDELVAADHAWLSDDPTLSLYLRPFMFGTDANLMLRPSNGYTFALIAFVAGGFFGDAVDAIDVWVSHEHHRAFRTGTGDVKVAGNYAPTFLAQRRAAEHGCSQVVWLDAAEGRWVEEMGGMGIFLVRHSQIRGDRTEVVTPNLTGTLLPSVTRDSLLTLAGRLGFTPREEPVSLDQWRADCASGRMTEAFACGTAAVVTPISRVRDDGGDWVIGDGRPGPVSLALRKALVDVHHGRTADPDGWLRPVAGTRLRDEHG